jgi:ABC-type multidrug transport system fused ATPase/permease subunit
MIPGPAFGMSHIRDDGRVTRQQIRPGTVRRVLPYLARQAVGLLLYRSVSTVMTLALVLAAMFYLSWQISLVALALIPLFAYPGRITGRWQQRLTREQMQLNAELATMTAERCNVAGAMLAKLYGRPDEETGLFADRATRSRDIAITTQMYGQLLAIYVTLLAALTTALVYGVVPQDAHLFHDTIRAYADLYHTQFAPRETHP